MSKKKEKVIGVHEYIEKEIRTPRAIKPLLNQPTIVAKGHIRIGFEELMTESELKAEIKRVNQVLRETHNPREYKQNKKYLERLERKLRHYGKK